MKNINADATFTVRIMNPATGLPVTGIAHGSLGGTWKFIQRGQAGTPVEQTITIGAGTWFEVEAGEYVVLVSAAQNNALGVCSVVGSGLTNSYVAVSMPEEVISPTAASNLERMLTTGLLDAYASNGQAPTLEQAIMAIHQALMSSSVIGTNWTIRKLNNSDTAFVITMNQATNPTAIQRA